MTRFFLALLVFLPLAWLASSMGAAPLTIFILSALAIIPLAYFLSEATEDLSLRTGPAVSGLLNAAFGNAPELIIGIFALSAGLIDVVKASIAGSILSNLLFGLGLAALLGGLRHKQQSFNQKAARVSASVFLLAAAALIIPGIFSLTAAVSPTVTQHLSLAVAFLLLIGYVASLFFTLHTHKHIYAVAGQRAKPERSAWSNLAIMVFATAAVAFMSDTLVASVEPLLAGFGWSTVFVGGIVIALIGNAPEYAVALRAALKNNLDLAISITLGSVSQMLMLVAPVLVLIGAYLGNSMNLVFPAFELAALFFAIFLANAVLEDGETNWFEGLQLLLVYAVVATSFFFHP